MATPSPAGILDTAAPTAGGEGMLTTGSITPTTVTLSFAAASDDVTPGDKLQYAIFYSTADNLGSVEAIEANGIQAGEWTLYAEQLKATDLWPTGTYYLNVLVKDEAGNKAAYKTASASTVCTPPTVKIHLAYRGMGKDGKVYPKWATNRCGEWAIANIGQATDSRMNFVSLALDSKENVWIGHNHYTEDRSYVTQINPASGRQLLHQIAPYYVEHNPIAIDSRDHVHVAHYTNGGLREAYYNGAVWATHAVKEDPLTGSYGLHPSIAIGEDDTVHFTYQHYQSDGEVTRLMHSVALMPGMYTQYGVGLIDAAGDAGYRGNSLVIDGNGRPITLYNRWTSHSQHQAYLNGSEWKVSEIASDIEPKGALRQVMNNDKSVRYAVRYKAGGGGLEVYTSETRQWADAIQFDAVEAAADAAIAVDDGGKIHLVYSIQPVGGERTLFYATDASGSWTSEAIELFGDIVNIAVEGQEAYGNRSGL
jgi:hypothetical protein